MRGEAHSMQLTKKNTRPHLEDHPRTCKWLTTMVSKSPKDRVIPLINGLFMAYKWRLLTTYKSWDDPPSTGTTPSFSSVAAKKRAASLHTSLRRNGKNGGSDVQDCSKQGQKWV